MYGLNGVSGRLFGTGTVSLFDYLCVHTPSDGSFKSFGGTYTFSVRGEGGVLLDSKTYPVASGMELHS